MHQQGLARSLGDSPYPSRVRVRPRIAAENQPAVTVQPTIVLNGMAGGSAPFAATLPLRAARLRLLLEEPLTLPLGSMQASRPFPLNANVIVEEREAWTADSLTPTVPRLRTGSVQRAQWLGVVPAEEVRGSVPVHMAVADTQPALPHARKGPAPELVPRRTHVEGIARLDVPAVAASRPAPVRRDNHRQATARAHHSGMRLRAPDAPPRSSARNAGILDGWERAPSRPVRRGRRRVQGLAVWLATAVLGVCSMLLAHAFTTSLLLPATHQQQISLQIKRALVATTELTE